MLKDLLVSQIDTLTTDELMLIYGYIELLKGRSTKPVLPSNSAHLQVREALKGLKTNLSVDILNARDERI